MGWLAIACLLFAVSCSKDNESGTSPFVGKWSGSYEGSDWGTWWVVIDEDGEIYGVANSSALTISIELKGSISDDGSFLATIGSAVNGGEFTGTMSADGSASGTWKNNLRTPPLTGTWSGSREE